MAKNKHFKRKLYHSYGFDVIHNGFYWVASDTKQVINAEKNEGIISFRRKLRAIWLEKKRSKIMRSDEEFEKYLKD